MTLASTTPTTNPQPALLNQNLPQSQGDWQQILNQFNSWQQMLQALSPAIDYTNAGNIGYWKITAAESAAGVTPTNYAYDSYKGDIRRWSNSIVLDGSTDNTTTLTGLWTTLATYKGNAYIPWNCKFNKWTVYSSVPANVTLVDDSVINSSEAPGYRNKHEVSIEDFGGKENDATYDNSAALNAAAAYQLAKGYNRILIPGDGSTWYFNTKPAPFTNGILIEGESPRSFLVRNYTAGSSPEAFLQWTGSAGGGGDAVKGGGMRQIGILAASGTTLGSAIDIAGTTTVYRPGYMAFEDVVITGVGSFDYGIHIDGTAITTSGSQGQRDINLRSVEIFNCAVCHLYAANVVHLYGVGVGIFQGGLGGTPLVHITGGGTATTNTNDVYVLGLECEGNITIDNCLNVHLQGRASGTFTSTSTAVNISFIGTAGTMSNSSLSASIVDSVNGVISAGNLVLNNSSIVQFSSNVASSATAGGGSALPATPTGYIIVQVGAGNNKKIPYYNT